MNFLRSKKSAKDTGYTEFIGEPIIFDGFQFPRFPSLYYFADGRPGKRVLFIGNENPEYQIGFEEGMKCMDATGSSESSIKYISSEHQSNGRYIHQLRTDSEARPGAGNYAFFHMEIPDENGTAHILPGQIVAPFGYQWSEGVEPILIDLMNGMAVCKTKGGGSG